MTGPVPGLFFVGHLYAHVIAFLFFTGIIAGHGWAEKARDPAIRYTCPAVVGLRAFLFICATTLGLLFLDTVYKQLVLGVFGYGNVMHWLGMVVLLATIGIEFIVAAAFVAPTRKALVTFGAVVATFTYLMQFHFPAATDVDLERAMLLVLGACIVVGVTVQGILAAAHGIYIKVATSRRVESRRDTPLWDIQHAFKRAFSFKANLVLWVLLLVEFVLSFEGWGLLAWLSLDAFLGAVAGIAGGILTFALLSRWRANRKLVDELRGQLGRRA